MEVHHAYLTVLEENALKIHFSVQQWLPVLLDLLHVLIFHALLTNINASPKTYVKKANTIVMMENVLKILVNVQPDLHAQQNSQSFVQIMCV